MESAIPGNLTVERTRHRRIPDDYAPPFPGFVARSAPGVRQVVMAYLGLQVPATGDAGGVPDDPAVAEALAGLDAAYTAPDGPRHHDRAIDLVPAGPGGHTDIVSIAYWDDPAAFDRWFAAHRDDWMGPRHAGGTVGRWVEVIRPTVQEFETLFTTTDHPEGVAALADSWSEEIQEHGYWGGMRDRIPLSQTDAMPGGGAPSAHDEGGLVRVRPAANLCLIRSGQDWTDTDGEERELYLGEVEPVLREGMTFLREEGRPVGCYANRYLQVLDEHGALSDRSFGMSWWRSLDALERWSESHPTHVAIFGAAMKFLSRMGPGVRLRLYHEVSVVQPDEQYFAYLNCAEGTGLLGTSG
jgi:aldoxime dehydratase